MLTLMQCYPDIGLMVRWGERQNLLKTAQSDDLGYVLHALLAAAFGGSAPKPFALRRDGRRPPVLLAYTQHSQDDLKDATALASPDVDLALGLSDLMMKSMPTEFRAGARLGFSLRVRPVVRSDRDGDRDKSVERDVFDAERFKVPDQTLVRSEVYSAWLTRHLQVGGAALERVQLESYHRSIVSRRQKNRSFANQSGPDTVFDGVLRVTDPMAFSTLLARGVGRHRAFGFGMLLLRPER